MTGKKFPQGKEKGHSALNRRSEEGAFHLQTSRFTARRSEVGREWGGGRGGHRAGQGSPESSGKGSAVRRRVQAGCTALEPFFSRAGQASPLSHMGRAWLPRGFSEHLQGGVWILGAPEADAPWVAVLLLEAEGAPLTIPDVHPLETTLVCCPSQCQQTENTVFRSCW